MYAALPLSRSAATFVFHMWQNFIANAWERTHTHAHTHTDMNTLAGWNVTEADLLNTHAHIRSYEWNTNLICRFSGISSFVPDYNLPNHPQ